ncbi:MIP/aquaporin family protein [Nocardioides sp.]|uniref:MIP/aquaporin family protein n=1 Tax=Nocardioides sp. TaxID=35761 RepID=UPI0019A21EEC|nr:MIP/aquaporin family protein [Nocardioides sp.]MBC7279285.1 aquaporin family protein [Nocardioides sp.]
MTEPTASGGASPARRTLIGELSAEFAGTMILILFGVGVVAQVVTGDGGLGDHDSIAWAWGIGVMLGIYTAGRISGAHLNPAVSLALAVFSDFEWRKVLPYSIAQVLGAFVAALIVRAAYGDAIASVDPGHTHATQGIFSTLPGNGDAALGISLTTAFADQVIGTAILLFLIMAITDAKNSAPIAWFAPVAIAFVIVGIGMAWGANAGYAINPARDFGPRLASFLTGYEGAWVTAAGDVYFWIPILGPLLGALVGAAAYKVLISRFLPALEEAEEVGTIPGEAEEEAPEPERKTA